jgi:hypothetical protein
VNEAPDYVEPVVAWRAWKAIRQGGEWRLASLFVRAPWFPHEPHAARCAAWRRPWRWFTTRHDAPCVDCACGIYATTPEVLAEYLANATPIASYAPQLVLGRVSLWGLVVECGHGWRAETAYPEHLFVPSFGWRTAGQAAFVASDLEQYDVPVDLLEGGLEDLRAEIASLVSPPLVLSPAA